MIETFRAIVRHLVAVVMSAISTHIVTLLTGLGFDAGEIEQTLTSVELLITVGMFVAFHSAYEKGLKPLFLRWWGSETLPEEQGHSPMRMRSKYRL